MSLTIQDVERLQQKLEDEQQDYQIELQEGNILVMGPSDIESSEIGAQLIFLLKLWVNPHKLGRIFDSSGGFIMPNTDLRAPDVSFVAAARLKRTVRDFAELVPDLVVEIKSKTDRISKLEDKIKLFLELGAKVGILINPDKLTVSIYRPNVELKVLTGEDKLTIDELLPGWEVAISELWPPVFE
ncbi:Uma2 family endonuclease [Nostocaceae cyanobacterium CENA369]|uniref:Uma2 family endonuclease n=1 Tax=Dendronalium phyllosphericum CENA369 TaxID=1725256 RepID=A0A8J7I5Z4_9NOST|nr:Uma2 family endonuclease [Dendronalium phyllosphericum]MBH8572907.1 Uma2 family endonuclease [Dendronalium phyllosphericum CENA369]